MLLSSTQICWTLSTFQYRISMVNRNNRREHQLTLSSAKLRKVFSSAQMSLKEVLISLKSIGLSSMIPQMIQMTISIESVVQAEGPKAGAKPFSSCLSMKSASSDSWNRRRWDQMSMSSQTRNLPASRTNSRSLSQGTSTWINQLRMDTVHIYKPMRVINRETFSMWILLICRKSPSHLDLKLLQESISLLKYKVVQHASISYKIS